MNRDAHIIDDLFRSALENYKEQPAPVIKESLNAILAQHDAAAYKRKYAHWKRLALFLLLLLTGIMLQKSDIFMPFKRSSTPKMPQQKGTAFQENKTLHTATNTHHQNAPVITVQKLNEINSPNNSEFLLNEKQTSAPINSVSFASGINHQLSNSLRLLPILNWSNTLMKHDTAPKAKRDRFGNSKPFWTIAGTASYEQVNYKLDSDLPNAINSIKHREVHEPSFSGGLLIARHLRNHWALQTGLIYFHTAIGISPQKIYAFEDPAGSVAFKYITSSGYAFIKPGSGVSPAIGDSLNTAEAKHTLKSLSLPLVIKYSIKRNKLTFRPGIGIEANILTSATVEVEIAETPGRETVLINKLNGAKMLYCSITTDAELQYEINKRISLSFRPAIRYALSPITEDNVVETFPYSFGAGIGINYKP